MLSPWHDVRRFNCGTILIENNASHYASQWRLSGYLVNSCTAFVALLLHYCSININTCESSLYNCPYNWDPKSNSIIALESYQNLPMIALVFALIVTVRSLRPVCFDVQNAINVRPSPSACQSCFEYDVDFDVSNEQIQRLSRFRTRYNNAMDLNIFCLVLNALRHVKVLLIHHSLC